MIIGLASVVATLTLGWAVTALVLWRRLSAARRAVEQLAQGLERAAWLEWWTKNAAETTPLDPDKPFLIRYAYAAALATDLGQFERDMHAIVQDVAGRTEQERRAAHSYAEEHSAVRAGAVLPWVRWHQETGKPAHSEAEIGRRYRETIAPIARLHRVLPDDAPDLELPATSSVE